MREMVHYCWPLGKDRFGLGIGCSLEMHQDELSYTSKHKSDGHRDAQSADLNMHPFGFGMDMQLSWNGLFVYAHKSLTPLFDTKHAPKAYPLAFGLGFTF